MLFGDRLKILREENKLTQTDLASIINVSARVIGYYESNDRFPKDQQTLVCIANYFGVSLDWLLGRTDIRSFSKDASNFLNIDLSCLCDEDVNKIKEYAEMLRQFKLLMLWIG
ncbi:MAG: helix-turn-helix transcriptional regulator [Clostridiaceae bacterium]|nr:helix-turn-helix transcriptional regulator [Clostridiaceae bacterium]